jgi:hypothetical protein
MADQSPETITQRAYYKRLLNFWIKMIEKTMTSKDWMEEYDFCFKICTSGREDLVYRAIKKLFSVVSVSDISRNTYLEASKEIDRLSKYLNRFWIPNEINLHNTTDENDEDQVIPIFDLAIQIWAANH